MTIPTLTDEVINDYHARLLEQIQGEAVEKFWNATNTQAGSGANNTGSRSGQASLGDA